MVHENAVVLVLGHGLPAPQDRFDHEVLALNSLHGPFGLANILLDRPFPRQTSYETQKDGERNKLVNNNSEDFNAKMAVFLTYLISNDHILQMLCS